MTKQNLQVHTRFPVDITGLWRAIVDWLASNVIYAIFSALLSFTIGYISNVLLMLFVFDGYHKTGIGAATGSNTLVSGSLVWGIGTMIVTSLLAYRHAVGSERFWQGVSNVPATIESLLEEDGRLGRVHLLAGACISLLTTCYVAPMASFVLALGLLSIVPSALRLIVSNFLLSIWSSLARRLVSARANPVGSAMAMTAGMLGAIFALGIGALVPSSAVKLEAALVCGILAWAGGRRRTPPRVGLGIFLIAGGSIFGLAALDLANPLIALADDGGWAENRGNLIDWWNSGGAAPLLSYSLIGAASAALGGPIGSAIGSLLGNFASLEEMPAGPVNPDIEYTYPDGRNTVLVYNPEYGGYINQLTGGFVDPGDIESWKQANVTIQHGVDDFRIRNAELAATHQDAPSQALQAIKDQAAARDKLQQNLSAMERSIIFGDGPAADLFKPSGTPGNILDRIEELRNELSQGQTFDKDKYERISKVYRDAQLGKTLAENRLPTSNQLTHDIISDTITNSVEEVATGQKTDGSTSWLGAGARILTAAVTAGTSEVVLTPVAALYNMKKYVDKGGDSVLGAFIESVEDVVKGELYGVAGGYVMSAANSAGKSLGNTLSSTGKRVQGVIEKIENSLSTGGTTVPRKIPSAPARPSSLGKTLSAAEVIEAKAARANARTSQTGEYITKEGKVDYKYNVKADPKVNVDKQMAGMTTPAKKQLQMTGDKFGVNIDVRSTTKYAHDPIAQGKAVPKPEFVKAKTISPEDVKLGAKEENLGLVGYFNPKKPVQGNMSADEYSNLMKRYHQRKQEFKDNWEHMVELKQEGKAYVKGGVVIDTKTGKPYTGDYDLFDIRDATTGKPLPRYQIDPKGNVMFNPDGTPKLNPVRQQIIKELQQPPFSAQHGTHMDWKYDHVSNEVPNGAPQGARSEFEMKQGIDKTILDKHKSAPDGDALITFSADQKPVGSWFDGER